MKALSKKLLKIHVIFYREYAKSPNAAYEKVHFDLLQSFFKIKLKVNFLKNLWINSVFPYFVLF